MRCVDLTWTNSTNQLFVVSFCFERTAKSYAQELGLKSYTISVRGHIIWRS